MLLQVRVCHFYAQYTVNPHFSEVNGMAKTLNMSGNSIKGSALKTATANLEMHELNCRNLKTNIQANKPW